MANFEGGLDLVDGVVPGVNRPLDEEGVIRPLGKGKDIRDVEREGVTRPLLEEAAEEGRGR